MAKVFELVSAQIIAGRLEKVDWDPGRKAFAGFKIFFGKVRGMVVDPKASKRPSGGKKLGPVV